MGRLRLVNGPLFIRKLPIFYRVAGLLPSVCPPDTNTASPKGYNSGKEVCQKMYVKLHFDTPPI